MACSDGFRTSSRRCVECTAADEDARWVAAGVAGAAAVVAMVVALVAYVRRSGLGFVGLRLAEKGFVRGEAPFCNQHDLNCCRSRAAESAPADKVQTMQVHGQGLGSFKTLLY